MSSKLVSPASLNPVKVLQYLSSADQPWSLKWPPVFCWLSSSVLQQPANHFPLVYLRTLVAFNDVFLPQDGRFIFFLTRPSLAQASSVINGSQTLKLGSYPFPWSPAPPKIAEWGSFEPYFFPFSSQNTEKRQIHSLDDVLIHTCTQRGEHAQVHRLDQELMCQLFSCWLIIQ